jgi:hypothetical protein
MERLCLVFDMDEAILHYAEKSDDNDDDDDDDDENILNNEDTENEFADVIKPGDKLFFRPGFWDFLEYVREQEGRIVIGMWTFGNKPYATAIRPYFDKDKMFEFLYTVEDQGPKMKNKELTHVVDNFDDDMRERLGIRRNTRLPKNIFLVDNRPENIYHEVNRKNGIMVESFMGHNDSDMMFENLKKICDSLLSRGKVPSKYMQTFKIGNKKMVLASIGSKFDDGLRPLTMQSSTKASKRSRRSRTGGGSSSKRTKKIMVKNRIKTKRLIK